MRIAHVTISHGPLDVRIFHKECRTLAAAGHDVHLLVPGPTPADSHGVRFHSLLEVGTSTAYVWSVWRALPSIYRRARRLRAAVYHLPDPSLIPLGLLLKLRGAKVVYDAHEDRPRQAVTKYRALGRPVVGWVFSLLWRVLEPVAKLSFDRFVAATPAIARSFPRGRTTTVCNFPLVEEFSRERPAYRSRPNEIVFTGGIHTYTGIREAVLAMALLPEGLDARLAIMGDFCRAYPSFSEELAELPGWDRVEYLGPVSRNRMAARLSRARAGLALLSPRPEHLEALGNKKFEYMAAGIPVIASDFPLWRSIVRGSGVGLTVDPRSPAEIADAIRYVLEHAREAEAMGERGRRAVASKYRWENEAAKLLRLYDGLAYEVEGSLPRRRRSPVGLAEPTDEQAARGKPVASEV